MDMLEVALKGALPPIVLVLLLTLPFGRRWLGVATGIGFVVAFWLLTNGLPAMPQQLWNGSNDATQWLCWCMLLAALVSGLEGLRRMPRAAALALVAVVVAATVWLPLTNLRRHWSAGDNVLHTGVALLLLAATLISMRRLPARRPGVLIAVVFTACLSVDAYVLVNAAHSGLVGQLAGVGAAALGTSIGLTLWRRPFELPPSAVLPLAIGHASILVLGYHLGYDPDPWVLAAAALAPFGLWFGELPALQKRPFAGAGLGLVCSCALLGFAAGRTLALAPEASGY